MEVIMLLKYLIGYLISVLLLIFPVISISKLPIIADHTSVKKFETIPDEFIQKAAVLRQMFRHASVGTTVNDGLDCIQGTRTTPAECTQFDDYKYDRRSWEFQPRGNSGWYGKVDDFVAEVKAQADKFDIFAFKYCYLDGLDGLEVPCGKDVNETTINKAWDYLRTNMESLESLYPDKIFVWWTIPLTQVGMKCTEELNTRIRNYVKENGKILFDIADIECYDPDGNYIVNAKGWEKAYKPYCGEQKEDAQACHPNWTGKLLLGKAFWYLSARIAGWEETISVNNKTNEELTITTYPNPSNGKFYLSYSLPLYSTIKVRIIDNIGRELWNYCFECVVNRSVYEINSRIVIPGIYYLIIDCLNGRKISKIIILP
jgi:hypothetical protein